MLQLVIDVYGAEPYLLWPDGAYDLADAIAEEARTVANDADADTPGFDGTAKSRYELEKRVRHEATLALRHAGDSYTDPHDATWRIVDIEDRDDEEEEDWSS